MIWVKKQAYCARISQIPSTKLRALQFENRVGLEGNSQKED